MLIKSTSSKGDFIIEDNGIQKIELQYKKWFSSYAKAVYDNSIIEIKPQNIWCSKFDIYIDEKDIGDIIFNWKGNMIIRVINENNLENNYILKFKGLWKSSFKLENENGDVLLILKPSLNWKKLNYNYDIEIIANYYDEKELMKLLIYSGYSANLYMSMIAAAVV